MPAIERRDAPPASPERRVVLIPDDLRAESRDAAEGAPARRRIVGHAAVFDKWTTLYEDVTFVWREVVRKGAFADALRAGADVVALWNHNADIVLGRTTSGTLTLSEDSVGFLSDTNPPDTQFVRDFVMEPIARGDVRQMSFAFTVDRSPSMTTKTTADGVTVRDYGGERVTTFMEGGKQVEERELVRLIPCDISPVAYPAYPDTDVALRSYAARRVSEIREAFLAEQRRHRTGRLRGMRMRLRLAEARHHLGVPTR